MRAFSMIIEGHVEDPDADMVDSIPGHIEARFAGTAVHIDSINMKEAQGS